MNKPTAKTLDTQALIFQVPQNCSSKPDYQLSALGYTFVLIIHTPIPFTLNPHNTLHTLHPAQTKQKSPHAHKVTATPSTSLPFIPYKTSVFTPTHSPQAGEKKKGRLRTPFNRPYTHVPRPPCSSDLLDDSHSHFKPPHQGTRINFFSLLLHILSSCSCFVRHKAKVAPHDLHMNITPPCPTQSH